MSSNNIIDPEVHEAVTSISIAAGQHVNHYTENVKVIATDSVGVLFSYEHAAKDFAKPPKVIRRDFLTKFTPWVNVLGIVTDRAVWNLGEGMTR